MKKNIYITGAAGYLGRELVDKFIENREYNLYLSFDNVKELKADYNIRNADIIIHLVAKHPSYQGNDMEDINYNSTKFLIDNAKDSCHFVFLSSEHVFKGDLQEECSIDKIRQPQTEYGKTKMRSEDYILSSNKIHSIIRTSMLFGGETNKRKNFINFLLGEIIKGNKLELYTDVFCRPTHVKDLVEFICYIIREELSGIFHASGTEHLNRYEMAKIICPMEYVEKNLLIPCSKPEDSWLQSFNLIPSPEFKKFNKRKLGGN